MLEQNELSRITFRVLSADEIKRMAVCEITTARSSGPGSLADERLGPLLNMQTCIVCNRTPNGYRSCPGHFGYIQLNEPVAHPLFLRHIVMYLKLFCWSCRHLLLPDYHLRNGVTSVKSLLEKHSVDVCVQCLCVQPSYTTSVSDGTVSITTGTGGGAGRRVKRPLPARELLEHFESIPPSELKKLGKCATDPRNFILTVLPVLPSRTRPALQTETLVMDDDLSIQYQEILKCNAHLADTTLTVTKRNKCVTMLAFRIKSLFDNSNQKSRHTNNRTLKGLKERIAGKSGVIRCNLMGKRVNLSGRSTIGPDVDVPTGWMSVPEKIANTLTVPVMVNKVNAAQVKEWVDNDRAAFLIRRNAATGEEVRINLKYAKVKAGTPLQPHDVIVRGIGGGKVKVGLSPQAYHAYADDGDRVIRNGNCVTDTMVLSSRRPIELHEGDVIERYMRDGDILLFNRQPTLHSGSMIGLFVKIRPGNTFRIPLSITKQLGADFDGDESSVFLPLGIEARAEIEELSSLDGNFFCAQGSTTYCSLVQDGLLGCYLLTKEWSDRELPTGVFMQLANTLHTFSFERYHSALARTPKKDARALVTMALPEGLDYAHAGILIEQGVLKEGCLTKAHLGGGYNSLLFVIGKYWSAKTSMGFVDDMQRLAHAFLTWRGFTIGLGDCLPTFDVAELDRVMCEGLVKAAQIENLAQSERGNIPLEVSERYICLSLSQTRDIGMRLMATEANKDNNFVHTVSCGSKGAAFNIAQITTLLGQQILRGGRFKPQLLGGRTLVHYPFQDEESSDLQTRFEARGMVTNSFLRGHNAREFFFHASAGREGVVDTALRTSCTGYGMRKLVKFLEDVVVCADGSVRDETKRIIQPQYAYTGLDPRMSSSDRFAEMGYLVGQCRGISGAA